MALAAGGSPSAREPQLVACCCDWWYAADYDAQGASPQTFNLIDKVFGPLQMYRAECTGPCAYGGGSSCLWTANKLVNYQGCPNGCDSLNAIVLPGNVAQIIKSAT